MVDLSAERLGLSIDYDASEIKGTITIRAAEPFMDAELWELTNRVLASRGFASVELPGSRGRMLSIVKLADAPGLGRFEETTRDHIAGYVSIVIRINHQPVKSIVDAVKLVLSKPSGSVTDVGLGGLVLIGDLKPKVDEAIRLIEMLDVPSRQTLIEKIDAEFVGPTSLAALVSAAAAARDAVAGAAAKGKVIASPESNAIVLICPPDEADFWRGLVVRFDQRETVVTKTYSPRHFGVVEVGKLIEQASRDAKEASQRGSSDQWRLVVDELTNTLIITGTPSEHERVAAIIDRLDSVPIEARRPLKTFEIRNRSVKDIVEVLTRLMEAGVLEGAQETTSMQPPPPGEARSVERIPAPPSAVGGSGISRATSELTASPDQAPTLRGSGVAGVTNNRFQGPIPATSSSKPTNTPQAPLTLAADEGTNILIAVGEPRLLAQLSDLIRRLDVRQPQVMLEVMMVNLSESDTLDLGAELKKIEVSGSTTISLSSLFGLGTPASGIPPSIPAGRGFSGVVLSPGDFSVVIRALQTLNNGRTLSLPKVLVNNNQQATLDSVLQQPFVSTNASDTVATTSFGGTDNAGTVITIKPQIAEGDHLILEYTITLSSFVGEAADPSIPPPKQSNNLSSVVTIPDGYTVVVGGLELSNEADAISQVPLLGSVPLLGEAFKNRSVSQNKSRFFVFIHSEVLRHENFEDLKYLSDVDAARLGIDDDWPDVEPRVIK